MPDNETARKVSIDYTLAAAGAFGQDAALEDGKAKKFRFVYCSGGAAERDQTRTLWFMQDYRRIRVRFNHHPSMRLAAEHTNRHL